jgi:glycosyltransferase involved in cell wall biosynthesis
MHIISPKNLTVCRAGEFIDLRVEIDTTPENLSIKGIFVRVGNKIIPCAFTFHNAGIKEAIAHYRVGIGLKHFKFTALNQSGTEIHLGSRYLFARGEDAGPRVSIPYKSKNLAAGISVIGSLNYEFGLGEAGRSIAKAVQHANIPNNAVLAPIARNSGKSKEHDRTQFARSLDFQINLFSLNAPDMRMIRKHWPRVFKNGQYNIGYWFYELQNLPRSWIDGFDGLSEVWVASEFVYHAVHSRSPVPVYIIPPAVSAQTTITPSRKEFGLPEDKMCILSIFDLNSYRQRKNPEGSIAAFKMASARNPNLHLVLRVNNSDQNQSCLQLIQNDLSLMRNVTIITEMLPRSALTRLQAACDVFISLHRSEGFGLNLAECMSLGKPVVATNWSANCDYMNTLNSCPVNYSLIELAETIGPYEKGQIWAEPSIAHAAEHLVNLSINPHMRTALGLKAKETIDRLFSLNAVAYAIRNRYDDISRAIYRR